MRWDDNSTTKNGYPSGVTRAVFQSDGILPRSSDSWKILVRPGASSFAASFKRQEGILSGPPALWGFSPLSSLMTALTVTVIGLMNGVELAGRLVCG